MNCQQEKFFDNTAAEFPKSIFWVMHVLSSALLFYLGMRFALRHAPLPFLAYRLLRRVMQ